MCPCTAFSDSCECSSLYHVNTDDGQGWKYSLHTHVIIWITPLNSKRNLSKRTELTKLPLFIRRIVAITQQSAITRSLVTQTKLVGRTYKT